MGFDYTAYAFVGVQLSEVVRIATKSEPLTRYNNETGVPYLIPNIVRQYRIDGEEFDYQAAYAKIEAAGLTTMPRAEGLSENNVLIGMTVSEGVSETGPFITNIENDSTKIIAVREGLKRLGYTGSVFAFLIMDAS